MAEVHPVTGHVLETPELRVAGLAELRALMAADIAAGTVARFPRCAFVCLHWVVMALHSAACADRWHARSCG